MLQNLQENAQPSPRVRQWQKPRSPGNYGHPEDGYNQGITIKEARSQKNCLPSKVNVQHAPPHLQQLPNLLPPDSLNFQISALKAELKRAREIIIQEMNQSIKNLKVDLAVSLIKDSDL